MAFLTKQGQALNLMVLYLRGIYYSFLTEGVKTDQVLKPSNYLLVNNLKTVSPLNSFHFFRHWLVILKMKKFGNIGH